MHFFCVLLTRRLKREGLVSNWKNVFTMWRAKRASEFEEQVLFQRNWIFKWISSLQKSFLKLSSHWHWMHAAHILSRWNIPKVFRVFKVTWYCCSTNELSWGKGCGSAHHFYIGIKKIIGSKLKTSKHKRGYFIVFAQSFLKTKSFVLFPHLELAAILRERFSSFPTGSVRLKMTPWKWTHEVK